MSTVYGYDVTGRDMNKEWREELIEQIITEIGGDMALSEARLYDRLVTLEKSSTFRELPFPQKASIRLELVTAPAFKDFFRATWGRVQWAIFVIFILPGIWVIASEYFSGASSSQPQPMRSAQAASEVREMTPVGDYCHKVTDISKGFAEDVARTMKVSVSSVRFIRSEGSANLGSTCYIKIDTPKGPQACGAKIIYSDGKDYWVGGMCW